MKETKQEQIKRLYLEEGMNAREISEEIGSSINSVSATIYQFGLNKMTDQKKNRIHGIMSRHLIGMYYQEENPMKAHYKITVENMIDFIDKYFEIK